MLRKSVWERGEREERDKERGEYGYREEVVEREICGGGEVKRKRGG